MCLHGKRYARRVAGMLSMVFLVIGAAQAPAACYGPREQLAVPIVNDFLASPAQILQQYPNGGVQMISRLRDLAATNPATLQPIINLLANATKDQKTAIGSALGQAAKICVKTDQAYATEIQNLLAATKDEDAMLAFSGVAGDQPTASTGGGGGGGGAIGGQTNPLPSGFGGSSNLQVFGSFSTPTSPFGFTSSVAGGAGNPTNTTNTPNLPNTPNTPNRSVSP
jgi:hypothetical protein